VLFDCIVEVLQVAVMVEEAVVLGHSCGQFGEFDAFGWSVGWMWWLV
jgi:hypothetical protein